MSFFNKTNREIFLPKTLRDRLGGVNAMKNFLGIETPPAFERSFKAATKLKVGIPTDLEMEDIPLGDHSFIVEDIHVKTREASQQTNLFDMREFLAIDKALQGIQGELLNNTSKLTESNKCIERDTKKLEEVENDPSYTDEQRQLYRDR